MGRRVPPGQPALGAIRAPLAALGDASVGRVRRLTSRMDAPMARVRGLTSRLDRNAHYC
jgi:hypothetical protein